VNQSIFPRIWVCGNHRERFLKRIIHRVRKVLRQRGEIPLMPLGVQLVSWKLRKPPIVIQRWSVVTNPALFAERTLEQLEAALAGKDCLAGHWSVRELLDRLEQVGVVVSVIGG
jgi:hypothetical protein